MARKKIIAGNWKMNMTPSEAVKLVETLKPLVVNDEVDVVFCVPAIDIIPVVEAAKGTNIQVGAENMYFEEKGAYTGEISPAMLVDAGVKYVVLGHSERREYFGETNEDVNKKVLKAFEHGITPIMCCGETLTQREQGVTMDFIRQQVKVGFQGVTADQDVYKRQAQYLFPEGNEELLEHCSSYAQEGYRILVLAHSEQETKGTERPTGLEPLGDVYKRQIVYRRRSDSSHPRHGSVIDFP